MTDAPTIWRLRITDPENRQGQTYIVRRGNDVRFFSETLAPLALANLVHEATAELTFALEDTNESDIAAGLVRNVLKTRWAKTPNRMPTVEVLTRSRPKHAI